MDVENEGSEEHSPNSILDHMMDEGLAHDDFQIETPTPHGNGDLGPATIIKEEEDTHPTSQRSLSRSQSLARSTSAPTSESALDQEAEGVQNIEEDEGDEDHDQEEEEEDDEQRNADSRQRKHRSHHHKSKKDKKDKKDKRKSSRTGHHRHHHHHRDEHHKSKSSSSRSRQVRYFVMKSYDETDVRTSQSRRVWATQKKNESILNEAFDECAKVVLFFSVNRSGHFQGYARMTSSVNRESSNIWSSGDGRPSWGGTFGVNWKTICELPFGETLHLHNPWNENKPVKICRDGQELPEHVGHALVKLFREYEANPNKRPSRRPRTVIRRQQLPRPRPCVSVRRRSISPRRDRPRERYIRSRSRSRTPVIRQRSTTPRRFHPRGVPTRSRTPHQPRRQGRGYYYTRNDFERMTAEQQRTALIAYQRRILADRASAMQATYGSSIEAQRLYAQRVEQARRLNYRMASVFPYAAFRGMAPRYRLY